MKPKSPAQKTATKLKVSVSKRKTTGGSSSVKKSRPKKGQALIDQVIGLSGIPADSIRRELNAILDKKNLAMENLTLDQLRSVAATYLREIMGSLLDKTSPPKTPSH